MWKRPKAKWQAPRILQCKHGGKLSLSKFIQCGKGSLANRTGKFDILCRAVHRKSKTEPSPKLRGQRSRVYEVLLRSVLILYLVFFYSFSLIIFLYCVTQKFTLTYFYCYLINCLSRYISIKNKSKKKKKLRTIICHPHHTSLSLPSSHRNSYG